jgi:hypothetical protein
MADLTVTGPDGQPYTFPSDATDQEILGFFQKLNPAPAHGHTAADELGGIPVRDPRTFAGLYGTQGGTPEQRATVGGKLFPLVAGTAAGVASGGLSLLPMLGVNAGAAALTDAASGRVQSVSDAARSAGSGALATGLGLGAGKALEAAAPTVMEGALRVSAPIARKFGRFGELGRTALDNGILPTQAGAEKAGRIIGLKAASKASALSPLASVPTTPIAQGAMRDLTPDIVTEFRGGLREDIQPPRQVTDFLARNPSEINPATLDAIKGQWDDAASAAHRAASMGVPLNADASANGALASHARDTLSAALPAGPNEAGYAARNAEIMNLQGVKQGAQGRADIPARGLDNMVVAYDPTLRSLVARALRAPAILGGVAHVMNAGGMIGVPGALAARDVLMQLLAQNTGGSQ